jgi:hypothetical protein
MDHIILANFTNSNEKKKLCETKTTLSNEWFLFQGFELILLLRRKTNEFWFESFLIIKKLRSLENTESFQVT